MDENNEKMMYVPYIALESAQARHERIVKRLTAAIVIFVVLLFLSNVVWVYEWTRYDYVVEDGEEITIDAGTRGNANYGARGELTKGSLDVVDKLSHTIKNLDKIIENYEESYSGMNSGGMYSGGSYSRARSYAPRRDSMGRYSRRRGYSRHGDIMADLRGLMDDAPDENTRMEFQRFIDKMEGTM